MNDRGLLIRRAVYKNPYTSSYHAGVCENNDHRHKEPYIAICISTHKILPETYIAIYRSL